MTELTSAFAENDRVILHYVSAGEGPLMLFLHGFPEFWYAWRHYLPHFAQTHRAVAMDLRGYNLSSQPVEVGEYHLEKVVHDIPFLARHLGYDRLTLVAHDWGGGLAWLVATFFPDLIERLIIIDAPHPAVFERQLKTNPVQQKASHYMHLLHSPGAEEIIASDDYLFMVRCLLAGSTRPEYLSPADILAYKDAWSKGLRGMLNYYRANQLAPPQHAGLSAQIPEMNFPPVSVPTLLIWGEQDPFLLTGLLEESMEYAPNRRVVRIPQASHWVVNEYPEEVIGHIKDFLREPLPRLETPPQPPLDLR